MDKKEPTANFSVSCPHCKDKIIIAVRYEDVKKAYKDLKKEMRRGGFIR